MQQARRRGTESYPKLEQQRHQDSRSERPQKGNTKCWVMIVCMRSGECVVKNKGQFATCQGLAVREVFANLLGVEKTGTKSERRQRGGMGCDKTKNQYRHDSEGPQPSSTV